jgi:hypothetical protein
MASEPYLGRGGDWDGAQAVACETWQHIHQHGNRLDLRPLLRAIITIMTWEIENLSGSGTSYPIQERGYTTTAACVVCGRCRWAKINVTLLTSCTAMLASLEKNVGV